MTQLEIIDQARLLGEPVDDKNKPLAIDRLKWKLVELVQVADCKTRADYGLRLIDSSNEQKARIEQTMYELFGKLQVKEFDRRIVELRKMLDWYVTTFKIGE